MGKAGRMRCPFAHELVLIIEPDVDVAAVGAAITVALCGHWEHEPPCPLAPHHTSAARVGGEVQVRTLFVVDPAREREIRRHIESAVADGTPWRVVRSGASTVLPEETDHVLRLAEN